MISEWLKVMLEEISRKKAEDELARIEEQRRLENASDTTAQRSAGRSAG
jgi:hypothetical protein